MTFFTPIVSRKRSRKFFSLPCRHRLRKSEIEEPKTATTIIGGLRSFFTPITRCATIYGEASPPGSIFVFSPRAGGRISRRASHVIGHTRLVNAGYARLCSTRPLVTKKCIILGACGEQSSFTSFARSIQTANKGTEIASGCLTSDFPGYTNILGKGHLRFP